MAAMNKEFLVSRLQLQMPRAKGPLDNVAGIHKYWARKPWQVIERLILQNSKEDDLVLDPFLGSGATALQANLLKRHFVGYDLNPVACRIAEASLSNDFSTEAFDDILNKLREKVKPEIMALYRHGDEYALWTRQTGETIEGVFSNYALSSKKRKSFIGRLDDLGEQPVNFLENSFPKEFYKDRFSYKGVSKVSDMFSKRNLAALRILRESLTELPTPLRKYFELATSNTLLHVSKLKSENIRPLGVNNYWMPDDFIEENVWWRFEDRVKRLRQAKLGIAEAFLGRSLGLHGYSIYNADCTDMKQLSDESVDYILTDPPYGEAIQYSELSYIWNSWFQEMYEVEKEVILNPKQQKDSQKYLTLVEKSVSEMRRVLKPTGRLTLAFHSKDLSLWIGLAEIMRNQGFAMVDLFTDDPKGSPFNTNWAKFSPKTDFYLTFARRTREVENITIDFEDAIREVRDEAPKMGTLEGAYDLIVAHIFVRVVEGANLTRVPRQIDMKKLLKAAVAK